MGEALNITLTGFRNNQGGFVASAGFVFTFGAM